MSHDDRQAALPTSRQVTQDITVGPDAPPMPGNCLQAAIASLLEREIDEVPHFVALEHWWEWALEAWLAREGLEIQWRQPGYMRDGTYHLIGGRSPRDIRHVVVGRDGEPVWDPHPSRAGLLPSSEEPGHGWQFGYVWPVAEVPPYVVDRRTA